MIIQGSLVVSTGNAQSDLRDLHRERIRHSICPPSPRTRWLEVRIHDLCRSASAASGSLQGLKSIPASMSHAQMARSADHTVDIDIMEGKADRRYRQSPSRARVSWSRSHRHHSNHHTIHH